MPKLPDDPSGILSDLKKKLPLPTPMDNFMFAAGFQSMSIIGRRTQLAWLPVGFVNPGRRPHAKS